MRKLNILNIVSDEKFIDNVIRFHDLAKDEVEHTYVVVGNVADELRFIKKKERVRRIAVDQFLGYLKNAEFDAVILHSLLVLPTDLIPLIPSKIAVMWSAWGYDLYQIPNHHPLIELKNIYRPETLKELKRQQTVNLKGILKYFLKKIPQVRKLRARKYRKPLISAIKRIDFFACVLSPEFELAKRIKGFRAEYVEYKYYDPARFDLSLPSYTKKDSILIGNSAAKSNNHLDILKKLRKLGIKGKELILPINYGAPESWKCTIEQKYQELSGLSLCIIKDYMEVSSYYDLIGHCRYAIFYHERQQALGNIYFLLETGCKIFLSESSVTYIYLKEKGLKVYSVQSDLSVESLNTPLTTEESEINRINVRKLYSDKESALITMRNLYEKIRRRKSLMEAK